VRPLALAMGYDIPSWIGEETLVLCSSYSGSTEETVATYDAARAAGAPRIAATTGGPLAERAREDGVPVVPLPGGFQPRAAVGYSLVIALEAAALCGAAPSLREEVGAAAALAGELAREWGPEGAEDGDAKRLARALHGAIPVITGAGLTASVAYRWKTQINENAKLPAFFSKLPEQNHNEIVGWAGADQRLAAVFLEDPQGDERAARRIEVTAELAAEGASVVERVTARGESRLERLVSLVLLGDLVSLYLAVLRGVDPVHIGAIDTLKERLAAARA
jgi:glucose/mannose-6-phosphate isomerase